MINKINKVIKKYGYGIIFKIMLSPFSVIITTPFMMAKLIWNCRVLLGGKLDQYHRFSGIPSTNCFFYWTQAYNIKKFGKAGISNLLGLGNYKISKFFFVPKLGNYLFWKFSTVITLSCFFAFAVSHLLWILNADKIFSLCVTVVISFSVLLYSCIDRVNYNCLGWLFFPLFIWSIGSDYFLLSSIASGFIAYFSITVCIFSFIIGIIFYFSEFNIYIIFSLMPAFILSFIRLYPAMKIGESGNVFLSILKLIGVVSRNVKYKRHKKISILGIYFSVLFASFLIISIYRNNLAFNSYLSVILIFILLLFLGEIALFRFADSHSYLISCWSASASYTIVSGDPVLLATFLFISNPIPFFGLFITKNLPILRVPERRPVFVGNAISKVRKFLDGIRSGEKILFQFDNPNESYNKIFDGYRNFYELLLYCGNLNNLQVFPDWYFIQETNTPDGVEVWGRNLSDVHASRGKIPFNYFIAYETKLNPLPNEFHSDSRISKIRSLDLSTLRDDFFPDPPKGMEDDPLLLNLYALK